MTRESARDAAAGAISRGRVQSLEERGLAIVWRDELDRLVTRLATQDAADAEADTLEAVKARAGAALVEAAKAAQDAGYSRFATLLFDRRAGLGGREGVAKALNLVTRLELTDLGDRCRSLIVAARKALNELVTAYVRFEPPVEVIQRLEPELGEALVGGE